MENLELKTHYSWFQKTFNENIPFFTIVDYNFNRTYVLDIIYNNTLTIIDGSHDPIDIMPAYNELQSLGLNERVIFLTSNYSDYTNYNNIIFFPFHFFRSRHFYKIRNANTFRKYKVSCLNRNPNTHKIYTFLKLHELPMFNEMLVTFNPVIPFNDMPTLTMDSEMIKQMPYDVREKLSNIELYRMDDPNDDVFDLEHVINHNRHPGFSNTYLNIVTETSHRFAFLSEKTFKPLISGQLMAFSSGPYTLSALKKIGFETFDNIINPQYDEVLNMYSRIDLMINEINNIYYDIEDLYHSNKEKIEFNQDYFMSNEIETKFLQPLIDIELFV